MAKECFAILKFIEQCSEHLHLNLNCDNKSLVSSYVNGRSDNLLVNSLLRQIYELLYLKKVQLELYWIDTATMKEHGCDGLSRFDYTKLFDVCSLTPLGASRLEKVYGSKPCIDLFASTVNFEC